ncbi:sigma factor [Dactylosporangium sp. McL0621]|uniref:sigma factor n=1 Tax=Dactylosporangium sp. McL0621 TaxID=3415678 RepID=UPI003CF1E747
MRLDDDARRRFGEYFAARHIVVRRTAYLLCGDWHWADDLTQSTFVKVAAGWHRIRDAQVLDAYARTCLVTSAWSVRRTVTAMRPPGGRWARALASSSLRTRRRADSMPATSTGPPGVATVMVRPRSAARSDRPAGSRRSRTNRT